MQSIPPHEIAAESFPKIAYAPGWKEFIVCEDHYGKKIAFDKADTNLSRDDKYNDFINEYNFEVENNNDVVEIRSVETGMFVNRLSIKAKLFFDAKKNPLIGIGYSYSGLYVTPTQGDFRFYLLKQNTWVEVTDKVIHLPDTQAYFRKPVDQKLVKRYSLLGVGIDFRAGSNEVVLMPFDASNLNCDENDKITGIDIDKTLKKKLCDMAHSMKPVYFTYDKVNFKFKRSATKK